MERRLAPPTRRPWLMTAALFLVAGCAGGVQLPEAPPASRIPALEARLAENEADADLLVRLSAAYVAAERSAEALPLLERARELAPAEPGVRFYLGLAYEQLDRPSEAVDELESFAEHLPPGDALEHVEGRIRLLRREKLRAAVREALEAEERLRSEAAPAPSTVAVFPFLFQLSDESLRPLSRAMAAMLAGDLAQSSRVTVLERLHVQALMDEIALGESGLVDPTTAARSGYLLGAGRIVQGLLEGDAERLRTEAVVVPVENPEMEGLPVEGVATLEDLFDMEVRMAFEIFDVLGVSLTAAERERINRRPTESLQALLAFGEGLEAADGGLYEEAAGHFRRAVSIDPGFEQAETEAAEAASMAEAAAASASEAAQIVRTAVAEIELGVDEVIDQAGERDPVQEALGTEGFGGSTKVRVLFPRPGGGR